MGYYSDRTVKVARDQLLNVLEQKLSAETDVMSIMDALEYYVNTKIEAACSDLDDKINKRGQWDPDY